MASHLDLDSAVDSQLGTALATKESSGSSSDTNPEPSGKQKTPGDGAHKPRGLAIKFNDVRLLAPQNLETQRRHAATMKEWKQSSDLWDHMSLHRAVSEAESSSQPAAQAENVKAMLAVLLRSHVSAEVAAQQEDDYNPLQLGMPVLPDHRFLLLPDTPLTLPMPPGRVDLELERMGWIDAREDDDQALQEFEADVDDDDPDDSDQEEPQFDPDHPALNMSLRGNSRRGPPPSTAASAHSISLHRGIGGGMGQDSEPETGSARVPLDQIRLLDTNEALERLALEIEDLSVMTESARFRHVHAGIDRRLDLLQFPKAKIVTGLQQLSTSKASQQMAALEDAWRDGFSNEKPEFDHGVTPLGVGIRAEW